MGSQGSVPRSNAWFSSYFLLRSRQLCRKLQCIGDVVVCVPARLVTSDHLDLEGLRDGMLQWLNPQNDVPFDATVAEIVSCGGRRGVCIAGLQAEVDNDRDAAFVPTRELSLVDSDNVEVGWAPECGVLRLVGGLSTDGKTCDVCLFEICHAYPSVDAEPSPSSSFVRLDRAADLAARMAPDTQVRITHADGAVRYGHVAWIRDGMMETTLERRRASDCRLVEALDKRGWCPVAFVAPEPPAERTTESTMCTPLIKFARVPLFVFRATHMGVDPRELRVRGVHPGYVVFQPTMAPKKATDRVDLFASIGADGAD